MILYTINDIKTYETRSDMPNADWTGTADFVVDETDEQNAELITKIKDYAPHFGYVTDDEGDLIDVVKTGEKPEHELGTPDADPMATLRAENKALKAQVAALTESQQFLEDCLVEMAEVVYA